MRAITIRQPWASLIVAGSKWYETRRYQPRCVEIGERIAIHAGLTRAQLTTARLDRHPVVKDAMDRAARPCLGSIVATAVLEGVYPTVELAPTVDEFELLVGDWTEGRYAWRLVDVRPMVRPIPCRGALGLWRVPAGVVKQLAGGRLDG